MRRYIIALTAAIVFLLPALASAAATVVVDKSTLTLQGSQSEQVHVWGQITFDNSYPTGGESLVIGTINTALTTAGYKGSCTTLERMYVANGEVSDVPYNVAWDDENSKLQVFAGATVTAEDTAGVASTPTAITVVSGETCTVTGATESCTLANTPISLMAGLINGSTDDGLPPNFIFGAPAAAQDVQVNGTTLTLFNGGAATSLNVTYAYVSTAGVASTPHTHTAGTSSAEATNGTDLSGLEIEFYAVCTQ